MRRVLRNVVKNEKNIGDVIIMVDFFVVDNLFENRFYVDFIYEWYSFVGNYNFLIMILWCMRNWFLECIKFIKNDMEV